MASLTFLKFAFPAFLIAVLVAVVTVCLFSVRRGGMVLHVLPNLVQSEPALVTDVVSNMSRTLTEVEYRAQRLRIALHNLDVAARRLMAQEKRRIKQDERGRFERREFCDNAWWWWKKIIISSNLSAARKHKLQLQQEDRNSTIASLTNTSAESVT